MLAYFFAIFCRGAGDSQGRLRSHTLPGGSKANIADLSATQAENNYAAQEGTIAMAISH